MPERSSPVLAAVLAGGRATRLGRSKPSAPLGGRPLIHYPLAALASAGLEAVVVAKPDTPLPDMGVPVWKEPAQPAHPVCGIVHALGRCAGRPLLVVAADMPFVTGPLLSWLAATSGGALVAQTAGRLHPLLARYLPEDRPVLVDALERARPLTAAVEALAPRLVGEDELCAFGDPRWLTFNLNTPADLAAAERRLAAGS